ncbi:TPA: hypothetical protein KP562_001341 [Clostridioides difficile]|nr:hypothetical protein [Clostridioides difficile]
MEIKTAFSIDIRTIYSSEIIRFYSNGVIKIISKSHIMRFDTDGNIYYDSKKTCTDEELFKYIHIFFKQCLE